jgi:hypothetical protein
MNRTIKEAIVKRFHCEIHGELRLDLADFLTAYKSARNPALEKRHHLGS